MTKQLKIGNGVSLDALRLVDTKMLVQANSGGGKSWLMRLIAEQAADKVPTIILDPEGEFATLRERLDLVLVGREGELQTNVRAAGLLARKLIELQVSAVVDLYDLPLPERRRFVRLFLESLISVPRDLWHPTLIMLDEAHLFCPERSAGDAESTAAVISLMSLGRKRGFAGVLATQRLSKLHKDAEAEANNVFIGRTWLDIDQKRAGDLLGIGSSDRQQLRELKPGEFFAFGPALSTAGVTRFKVDQVKTTHPKAGERHKLQPPKASDAIRQIAAQLADLPQKAEEEIKNLEEAKIEVAKLRRELAQATKSQPKIETKVETKIERVEVAVVTDAQISALKAISDEVIRKNQGMIEYLDALIESVKKFTPAKLAASNSQTAQRVVPPVVPKAVQSKPTPKPQTNGHSSPLPDGERKILTAIAQYPEGAGRDQLSILTGYKRSSRDTYIQRLKARGYVEPWGDALVATPEGVAALGDFVPLPTGEDLRDYWMERLPEGERKVFSAVVNYFPQAIPRETIDQLTGYKRSSRDTYIQRLSARRLVEAVGREGVRASENLF